MTVASSVDRSIVLNFSILLFQNIVVIINSPPPLLRLTVKDTHVRAHCLPNEFTDLCQAVDFYRLAVQRQGASPMEHVAKVGIFSERVTCCDIVLLVHS